MLIKLPTHATREGHDLKAAGKLFFCRKFTSAAKSREPKQSTYRSAEALDHPKAAIHWSFFESATRLQPTIQRTLKRQQEKQLAGEGYFSRIASK